jgi:hypothetical protein
LDGLHCQRLLTCLIKLLLLRSFYRLLPTLCHLRECLESLNIMMMVINDGWLLNMS